ncbi:MAG: patatin-like phospholipase domain-containing protein [Leptospiraceae bacterium]|nr:patatin-like phospholipase domain-containing protein [Leptospiraceae bacterium]
MAHQHSLGKYYLVEGIPIFHNLSESEIDTVAEKIQILEYKKGELIYTEGNSDSYFFAITQGLIEVFRKNSNDKIEIVEILRKGDYFGIISLLTNQAHSTSARCLEDTRILRMNPDDFRSVIQDVPSLGHYFSKILSLSLKGSDSKGKDDIRNRTYAYWGIENRSNQFLLPLMNYTEHISQKQPILLKFQRNKAEHSTQSYIKIYNTISKPRIREILESFITKFEYVFIDLTDTLPEVRRTLLEFIDCIYLEDKILSEQDQLRIKADFPNLQIEKVDLEDSFLRSLARKISGKRVGIALGGGAALGLSQIGILKVCQEENLEFDMISGTSIGAVVGAYWAAGFPWEVLLEVITEFDSFFKFFKFMDFSFQKGLFSGKNIRSLLEKHLKGLTFADLKIPLKLIACDILTRTEVELSEGNLVDAIMASVAIPGVFSPIHLPDGRVLVDGGIVNPLPVSSLSKEGITRIIAVNSMPSSRITVKANDKNPSIMDIIVNSLYSLQYRIGKYSAQEADVYINPVMENSSWYEFYRGKEFMEFGEKKTKEVLPEIKELFD